MEREYNGIWVYANHHNKKLTKSTLELIAKGRQLADKSKVDLSAVLLGYNIEPLAHELITYGVDKIYLVNDEKLKLYSTIPYAKAVTSLIRMEKPKIVLFVADTTGRDLAPRIATRLETGLTADCTDLDIGDYHDKKSGKRYDRVLYQIRPAFGGDIMATIFTPECHPQMATVRHGIFEPLHMDPKRTGKIIHCNGDLEESDLVIDILKTIRKKNETSLEDAKIIVGGGRGVGGPEGFKMIKKLADLLGAEVGATRAAVDAGWISSTHQIGLTGQAVKPDIYIACGISGAIQHLVGVKNSQNIVAINKDPSAPIFEAADYGIVGDLFDTLRKLLEKIETIRKGEWIS
ncbi:MAG: electron transfer flavoprotein subunit alpha/FixB family protein [Candidatus Heimdallarchaeota archaeon]